jgi:hypothetical protein
LTYFWLKIYDWGVSPGNDRRWYEPLYVFTDSTNKIAPIQLGSNSTIILDWQSRTLLSASLSSHFAADNWDSYLLPWSSEYRWSRWILFV